MNLPADIATKVTQKEFAALIGVSEPMVNKHKNAGRLVMDGRLVCVRESLDRIDAWKDPARGGDRTGKQPHPAPLAAAVREALPPLVVAAAPPAAGHTSGDTDRLSYNLQAAREKLASAQLRELELARSAGELVLKRERDDAEFGRARQGREAVMSIPDRMAVVLAAVGEPERVHSLLTAECRRVCNQLAGETISDSVQAEAA